MPVYEYHSAVMDRTDEMPPLEVDAFPAITDSELVIPINGANMSKKTDVGLSPMENRIESGYKTASVLRQLARYVLLAGITAASYVIYDPRVHNMAYKAQTIVELGGSVGTFCGIMARLARSDQREAEALEKDYYMDPSVRAQQAALDSEKQLQRHRIRNIFRRKNSGASRVFGLLVEDSL